MEEEKSSSTTSSSSGANSRWNPTKEQISVLEAMYRQGVRTPTAEQIQQIAGKLREYGTIEGKNVFYWFQNHKARQRQKQKQETVAYFNRFLRKAASAATAPAILPHPVPFRPPVMCSPYYFHPGSTTVGYYPPLPPMLLPGAIPRRPTEYYQPERPKGSSHMTGGHLHGPPPQTSGTSRRSVDVTPSETLQLFPLHPTGILEERAVASPASTSTDSNSLGGELEEEHLGGDDGPRPVLNFL